MGFYVGRGGYLSREDGDGEEGKKKNGKKNGNGNGGNGGNGNGGNGNGDSNGGGDGGGGMGESTILEKRDGKSAKDKDYSLKDWFKGGGWKQTGGKYDGKPCAKQPGQKTKPFCRDADDRASMSKDERNRRASKKRREDPNPNRKGKAKMVTDSYDLSNWRVEFKALQFETVDIIGTEPLKPTQGIGSKMLGEKCWKGYKKKGMKTMFGKKYPNCVKEEETIDEKCWDSHKQVGMKKKGGKMVPNCVPKNEELEGGSIAEVNAGPSTPVKQYGGKFMPNPGAGRPGKVRLKPGTPAALRLAHKEYSDWKTEIFEGDGDHEYEMARRQLATIKNAVSRLEKKMGKTGEGELKAWVQSKLTRSADDIDTVADYVTNEETIQEGEKDACYHKVKSRYSVWPSAYASGALVKCRKVGAANWGNKSKTKKEEVQYLNAEDYQRIQEYGNVYTIIVLWRGKSYRLQIFFQGTQRPSKDEVKLEVEKIYPGGITTYYFPSPSVPGKPIIVSTRN